MRAGSSVEGAGRLISAPMTGVMTRYRAIRKIAEGGSAAVYLGEQLGAAGFKRPVILKRLRSELLADEYLRQILLEEAQLAMKLHHSNLVEVLDLGESEGRWYLVLELVDGWTLHHVLRRAREARLPLPPTLALSIAAEICRGLAYAHERKEGDTALNIVHRDVCPNNVLLSRHAEVKLIDFGIAKSSSRPTHTGLGRIKGKPTWMSPEQARAEPLDARSDLYSVGSVLFAMLADVPPYTGSGDLEVISAVSKGELSAGPLLQTELSPDFHALVMKAMAKYPGDRFQSAQEMLLAIEALQRSTRQPAGRSELELYLRRLSARDGDQGITGQPLGPVTHYDLPEELSRESQTETRAFISAPPKRRRPWLWALVLLLAGLFFFPLRHQLRLPLPLPRGGEGVPTASEPEIHWAEWADDPAPLPTIEPLNVTARLAPKQSSPTTLTVVVESEPAGAQLMLDERAAGTTPTTLRLKSGRAYDLCVHSSATRRRLLLTPRAGKPPTLSLRESQLSAGSCDN